MTMLPSRSRTIIRFTLLGILVLMVVATMSAQAFTARSSGSVETFGGRPAPDFLRD